MTSGIIATTGLTANQRRFLAAYSGCGCLTRAAEAGQVSRGRHYVWLKESEEYQAAFAAAQEQAADLLEFEARRRAVEGLRRLKFHNGKPITDPSTGAPYFEHEFSDVLLIFLLKAARPEKYRERSQIDLDARLQSRGQVTLYMPDNGRDPQMGQAGDVLLERPDNG